LSRASPLPHSHASIIRLIFTFAAAHAVLAHLLDQHRTVVGAGLPAIEATRSVRQIAAMLSRASPLPHSHASIIRLIFTFAAAHAVLAHFLDQHRTVVGAGLPAIEATRPVRQIAGAIASKPAPTQSRVNHPPDLHL
ncbi:hypothetical protein CJU73_22855, partial [Pseudomonas fragi]